MQLELGRPIHLAYCTNIHPGETWDEIFANLRSHAPSIRDRVAPGRRFGIGLRLSDEASVELIKPARLEELKRFLDWNDCYVFTINAFPFGRFHGTKIKEEVFAPDWTKKERLDFTLRSAEILAALLTRGEEGSISTLPGSFGEWIDSDEKVDSMAANLADCALGLEELSRDRGRDLHLGLEPEPLGYFEDIAGTIDFFDSVVAGRCKEHLVSARGVDGDLALEILRRRLAICYDTCHMAIEYENPGEALAKLAEAGIRIGKFQISSALKCAPNDPSLRALERFADGVYLHQVVGRNPDGTLRRWKDIAPALADRKALAAMDELRVHCHVPLHWRGDDDLAPTSDHIVDLLSALGRRNAVAHFEIETYTWDVLPPEVRGDDIDEAVAAEYRWFLDRLSAVENPHPPSPA